MMIPNGMPLSTSTGALLCLLTIVPSVLAFAPSSGSATTTGHNFHRHIIDASPSRPSSRLPPSSTGSTAKTTTSSTALGYANSPLPSTNDPYVLLGLSSQEGSRGAATAHDEKEVKRAFRRLTKLYHPDAVTTKDSTEAERKQANDDFARINAAYQAIVNPEAAEVSKVRGYVCVFGVWDGLLGFGRFVFFFFAYFSLGVSNAIFPSLQLALLLSSLEPPPNPNETDTLTTHHLFIAPSFLHTD